MEVKDIIEIIKVIVPVISAVGVAILASVLTLKNNIKIQKKFTLQKLRIDKTQEVVKYFMEYTKELSVLLSYVNRCRFNDIKTKEFQLEFFATQEKINEVRRSIQVNRVFFQEIQKDVDAMGEVYVDIIEEILDTLFLSETLPDEEKASVLHGLQMDIESLQMCLHTIIEDLNNILKQELNDLEEDL